MADKPSNIALIMHREGPPTSIAEEMKTWRTRAGLTQAEAAARFKIPMRTWKHSEQGRGFPYPELLLIALKATANG